ncbi:nicotinate dehydrogenase subunit A [Algoriphagus faecimaris]|uniref:Nicotinate dehydrogenase subunit A n=1 Tax=Algoriphagus faecimaris TaxID=686796 RepID=A0A1G6TNS9_9BACT|nr:(2Fe-2S)-binding protein [Algoriphagus faecimaris]SDD30720.1 nicotinate dehydrogenase subunit A [Algoriphagus faecimaris]
METINFQLNKTSHSVTVDPEEPLLYILREEFGLNGAKFGCGLHQCGACMVLVDGKAQFTCRRPCKDFKSKNIETIEGLENENHLHPVQEAFIETQAAQCGYCLNGMLIATVGLLRENPNPSEEQIRASLQTVLCRCGTHSRFFKAVQLAAKKIQ